MLNPKLSLNQKLFNPTPDCAPTRDGYGDGLLKLGESNPEVVVLSADLTESTRNEKFSQKYPQRFFECGVAEQNMAAIAAGLAVSGKTPFISSYATFCPGKNWETIRTTIVYNQANVKIAGHHSGIVTGPDGATHQATEDIASARAWPGIRIIVPCDSIEAEKATLAAAKTPGPAYLRFTRDKTPIITTKDTPFDVNKAEIFWIGDNPQVTIFAMGHLLYFALLAAKQLEEEKIFTLVVNVPNIKPLDQKTILEAINQTGAAVTVEDHQITGGLGGAIAEFLAKYKPAPIEFIGLQDTFPESGTPAELIEKYGLGTQAIKEAVKKVLVHKRQMISEIPNITNIFNEMKTKIKGEVLMDKATLLNYSHDASLFEIQPTAVVFPKDSEDVKELVKFVSKHKHDHSSLSLTGRSAGTDMSGGSINDSIIVAFEKHFNRIISITDDIARVQPGVFYRDFEKETLKHGLLFPSYPASREICAMGGIVNNNSGGEKSLEYGKTEKYIKELKVVLADGEEHTIAPLSYGQLKSKTGQDNFEGEIYRKIYKLVAENYDLLQRAKPKVSKNSAGYYLWNIYDPQTKTFDLTQLFVGAQGTLGLVTEASIKLIPVKQNSEMMVIFVTDFLHLGEIINKVLPLQPESFEVYDDHTLKLALKFFPSFAKKLGAQNLISTGLHFLPEFGMLLRGGIPKLVMQVEFTGDNQDQLNEKVAKLQQTLEPLHLKTRVAPNKQAALKYWLIRRESFNLLRQKIKNKHTAPFIDDFIVRPEYLPEFLPKINAIFDKYPHLIYTVAGHIGDGNFHIIPLMDIEDPKQREIIPILSKEVYALVLQYKGSITAEHNDGLIRTPFLQSMYGEKVCALFAQTKHIFDPDNIFNPRKKVGGDLNFAMQHIRNHW